MKKALHTVCTGAAHSNPFIDHCGVCMRHSWGKIFVCPTCPDHPTLKSSKSGRTYTCPMCGKRADVKGAIPLQTVQTSA